MPNVRGSSQNSKSIDYKAVASNKAASDKKKSDAAKSASRKTTAKENGSSYRILSDKQLQAYKDKGGKVADGYSRSFDGKKDQSRHPDYGGDGKFPDRVPTLPAKDKSRVKDQTRYPYNDVNKDKKVSLNYFSIRDKLTKAGLRPTGARKLTKTEPETTNYFKLRKQFKEKDGRLFTDARGNPLKKQPITPDYPYSTDGQPTYKRPDTEKRDGNDLPGKILRIVAPNIPGAETFKHMIDGALNGSPQEVKSGFENGLGEIFPAIDVGYKLSKKTFKARDAISLIGGMFGGFGGYAGGVIVNSALDDLEKSGSLRNKNQFEKLASDFGLSATPAFGAASRIETGKSALAQIANRPFMQSVNYSALDARGAGSVVQPIVDTPSEAGSKSIIEALTDESYNPANASFWQGSIVPAAVGIAGLALVIFGAYSLVNKQLIEVTK